MRDHSAVKGLEAQRIQAMHSYRHRDQDRESSRPAMHGANPVASQRDLLRAPSLSRSGRLPVPSRRWPAPPSLRASGKPGDVDRVAGQVCSRPYAPSAMETTPNGKGDNHRADPGAARFGGGSLWSGDWDAGHELSLLTESGPVVWTAAPAAAPLLGPRFRWSHCRAARSTC